MICLTGEIKGECDRACGNFPGISLCSVQRRVWSVQSDEIEEELEEQVQYFKGEG